MPIRFASVPWDCQPLEAGVIAESFRRGLLFVGDAGQRVPGFTHLGRNRALVGLRGAGRSGAGWTTDSTNYLRGQTDSSTDAALFEISAGGSWTMQFVVENVGGAGTNPGFTRSNSVGTGTTFILQNGSNRRPWVRVNSADILQPTTGAQWVTGQKLNLIVRFFNASRVEAWWDGRVQHFSTHSTSQEAMTGGDAIYGLFSHQQGGSGAQVTTGTPVASRAWARYLDDQEMHALARDELALYEPRTIWVPVSASAATPVGRADETDTAFALSAVQILATGRADETDLALALAPVQVAATGRADEADTALALAPVQITAVGRADETDTALALSAALAVGRADEVDTALALAAVQIAATGRADEADTALALAPVQVTAAGLATEADTAFALVAVQIAAVGRADEIDTAFALTQPDAVGVAEEFDTAFALAGVQIRSAGLAAETDVALALAPVQVIAVGRADELDVAFALGAGSSAPVGLAVETDLALALTPRQILPAGLALEIDTSFALPALQKMLVGRADELDQACVPGVGFDLPHVISPRLFTVPSENRRFTVPAENRTYVVPASNRTLNI